METIKIIQLIPKSNKKEFLIEFENYEKYIIPIDLVYKYKLKAEKYIPEEKLEELKEDIRYYNALKFAYQKATSSMKTKQQIMILMLQKGYSQRHILATIAHLENLDIINDRRYTQQAVEYLMTKKKYGSIKIKQLLRSRGISEDLINEVLSNFSENEDQFNLMNEIIQKNLPRIKRKPLEKRYQYTAQMLQRKGFPSYQINKFLNNIKSLLEI